MAVRALVGWTLSALIASLGRVVTTAQATAMTRADAAAATAGRWRLDGTNRR
jgi:hypothetical protein